MPKFSDHKLMLYAPEQVFDLVADIEKYPEFLPWCLGARVLRREGDVIHADLEIGWKLIREKFTSRVTLDRPNSIHVDYVDGPMRFMTSDWTFTLAPGGCDVGLVTEFEFKSRSLQMVMGVLFNEAAKRMVSAFETRARRVLKPRIVGDGEHTSG
jgi:coenzyme Q-binding protein COQ10